jgi:hypothetical protein
VTNSGSVDVSAQIGFGSLFTIFGYTSPNSPVELLGKQIGQKTRSDSTGYFEFKEIIVPTNLKDVCLSSLDTNNRPTPLSCLTLPLIDNQHRRIGPILLAPSISIDNNNPRPGENTTISGQSIPNQKIEIKLFPKSENPSKFPKQVMAAENLFSIVSKTDHEGNYSLSLPTSHANQYLVKSQSFWQENPSPPSFQIVYRLPDYKLTMLQLYPWLLPLLFLQVCFIIGLLFARHKQKVAHYWLALYPRLPAIYPKSLWPKY